MLEEGENICCKFEHNFYDARTWADDERNKNFMPSKNVVYWLWTLLTAFLMNFAVVVPSSSSLCQRVNISFSSSLMIIKKKLNFETQNYDDAWFWEFVNLSLYSRKLSISTNTLHLSHPLMFNNLHTSWASSMTSDSAGMSLLFVYLHYQRF